MEFLNCSKYMFLHLLHFMLTQYIIAGAMHFGKRTNKKLNVHTPDFPDEK
jgi:hypothetical protein